MSDLQLGLLAVGAIVVVGVFLYNKWQDRQYRRKAEASFGSRHEDVLMRSGNVAGAGVPTASRSADRVEPMLRSPDTARHDAGTPEPVLSELLDYVVPIEMAEEAPGRVMLEAAAATLGACTKPVCWEGFDEARGRWETLQPDRNYSTLRVGLQLVDRRGSVSVDELNAFGAGLQQTAAEAGALAAVPDIASASAKAGELDRFCDDVDIQIAVHVVTEGAAFAGTRVRALAEAAGLELDSRDGKFRRREGDVRTFCTLANFEPAPFGAASIKSLVTRGVTLELDVPRAPRGAFDQFLQLAQQLAQALGGRIVDDNRQLLGAAAFDAIGLRLQTIHRNMEAHGLRPGGALARRLFS